MKTAFALFTATVIGSVLSTTAVRAEGFIDGEVLFYGEVRQIGGAQTTLLQSGTLEVSFVNQQDPANIVTLSTSLRPTGVGALKPYSYALKVPLKYLPDSNQKSSYISISAQKVSFQVQNITIDGRPATLPDGSQEFYGLNFGSRASQNRMDLIVNGDSTDTDGDGLPDWWERLHGMDPNSAADALADLDGDGWNNLSEFHLGSNPTLSNTEPMLATTEILVPESGEAGLLLQVLDSDTSPDEISIMLTSVEGTGFEIKLDGAKLPPGDSQPFTIEDLQSGRLTIAHVDRNATQVVLPFSLSDSSGVEANVNATTVAGGVIIRVASASSVDGNEASLWLDGDDLPVDGEPIGNWSDRSGNGRHAMQPLAEHQPVVSGHSANFAASETAHLFFQDGAVPVGDHTVLVAYRASDSLQHSETVLASNRGQLQLTATGESTSYPGSTLYQMDDLAVRGYENASGAMTTSIFRRESDLLQNIFGLSYDGENVPASIIDPVLPTLGARRSAIQSGDAPVSEDFGGQLHELLVFPSALPEQKLRDVHDYLLSKWSDAIIWDLSAELKVVTINDGPGTQPRIIRGGHGADVLSGGAGDDILSGGPGVDRLTGSAGSDSFVFGGVDTGNDSITDFELAQDIIDLSALFWGMSGDARQYISVRLDSNFSTPIPTIDSVLLVQRPDDTVQEIVLQNTVVGATQLVQLIVEGRIRMGGLGIPTEVQIALAPGSASGVLSESLSQPFAIEVTRSGEGVAAALDVPLGLFGNLRDNELVIEGASEAEGQRALVSFARGETSKILVFRPVPDLESEGAETWQISALPNHRYSINGAPVETTIDDIPNLGIHVLQASAIADTGQRARVNVHRDGDLTQSLTVGIHLRGTAVEGVHIASMPRTITIPAGAESRSVEIEALAPGLATGPKVVQLQLVPRNYYQLGDPHEVLLYAGLNADDANGAGFDRWLAANTNGRLNSIADLMKSDPQSFSSSLLAYAFGDNAASSYGENAITIQIVDGRPVITVPGSSSPTSTADIRWGIQSSERLSQWVGEGNAFVEVPNLNGVKLVGQPLDPAAGIKFYRLNLNLDPAPAAGLTLGSLTGASKFGINGEVAWATEAGTGNLVGTAGSPGQSGRIIAEVDGPKTIRFAMEILGAGDDDSFAFFIDGVRVDQTSGGTIQIDRQLDGSGPHLLMWEFERGEGQAVVRRLSL